MPKKPTCLFASITTLCVLLILIFNLFFNNKSDKTKQEFRIPNYVSFKTRMIIRNFKSPLEQMENKKMPGPDDFKEWQKIGKQKDLPKSVTSNVVKKFNIKTKEHYIRGVRVLEIIPQNLTNLKSALIYTHPGGLYSLSPEALLGETAAVATQTKTRIFSIDYRLLPQSNINLTIKDQAEDIENVYKGIVEDYSYKPKNIAIWGCSAGSTLLVMAVNKMSKENYPLPAAIAPNGGLYDMSLESDTIRTAIALDKMIHPTKYIVPVIKMAKIDAKDPEISTILEDYKNRKWPATLLVAGGREVLLSDARRMNTKLKLAGHDSELYVHDVMPHCWPALYNTKEAKDFFYILDDFFRRKGVYNINY